MIPDFDLVLRILCTESNRESDQQINLSLENKISERMLIVKAIRAVSAHPIDDEYPL